MITPVVMPQMGLEVTEGTIVEIHVETGSPVSKDDPVMVLATDKADADIVAPVDGLVRAIAVSLGDTVQVGATLLWLADSLDEPLKVESAEAVATAAAVGATLTKTSSAESGVDIAPTRLRAAPVARRAAAARGIALEKIDGSGPKGRITLRDVVRAASAAPSPRTSAAPVREGIALETLTPARRAVARRMTASQRDIPQFELVREVDATHLLAEKEAAAADAEGVRFSLNDLLMQAIAETLTRHPDLAAVFVDGEAPALRRPQSIDVGLAVATAAGLLVPVVRNVHERSLREIAGDRSRLVAAARTGALGLGDMTGGTTTLSNLGNLGVDRFAAMVNPGESTIVAVGRTIDRVVPRGRGVAVIPALTLTLTFDHRVVDGATGARAVAELAELLEGAMPWRI
jgi:pyruvate dehydrogenase E2 component (dihydrolipoamide acetyltransferase)